MLLSFSLDFLALLLDASSSEGNLGAQLYYEKARSLSTMEVEGAEGKLREKEDNRKLSRESSKKLTKMPHVTIHRSCQVFMSSPGATTNIDPAPARFRSGFGPASIQL